MADEAREKLAALARATVTDLHVDGWSPRDALVMGAMHAVDALVLSHKTALMDAIGVPYRTASDGTIITLVTEFPKREG